MSITWVELSWVELTFAWTVHWWVVMVLLVQVGAGKDGSNQWLAGNIVQRPWQTGNFHTHWSSPWQVLRCCTSTTPTTILWPIVRDCPGEPVPEETITHSHPSWSSITLYLLPPSAKIHIILPVQFMCLTIFLQNLSPSPLWFTSWTGILHFILRTFLHPIIVFFLQYIPIPTQPVLL